MGQYALVSGQFIESRLRDAPKNVDRIVVLLLPEHRVQAVEQLDRIDVPVPPQVVGDLPERFERFRKRRFHLETFDRPHGFSFHLPSLR